MGDGRCWKWGREEEKGFKREREMESGKKGQKRKSVGFGDDLYA